MGEATIDFDLESYKNQIRFRLENAINAASNISDLGNKLANKLEILYNSISKLNGKIEDFKYNEIVDVSNLKSVEFNSYLKMLIRDIPSEIEHYAKVDAIEKSIMISNVKYFKEIKIKHINLNKNKNKFDIAREEILKEINDLFDEISTMIKSLYGIDCTYNMCQYKLTTLATNINTILNTLISTINKKV